MIYLKYIMFLSLKSFLELELMPFVMKPTTHFKIEYPNCVLQPEFKTEAFYVM